MRRKVLTSRFLQRLALFLNRHPNLEEKARDITTRLVADNPHLRVHALHGSLKGFYAVSVTQSYWIVFALELDTITFIDIGSHDEVY